MEKVQKIQYTLLGNSGLKISRIGFGNWLNCEDAKAEETISNFIKRAYELGINFFDTAEIYGQGKGEIQFGKAFKNLNVPRENLVISTKLFWKQFPSQGTSPNTIGLSRKHILEGMKASLQRLQLDYVDIVFCHRFDNEVNLEETCRAMDQIIKNGWAFYWGTSEWTAANIFEAFMICEKYNLIKPVADQCQYNMFVRDKMEVDYARLFDFYNYGTTVWSPLAYGLLTGKYNDGIPKDSRVFNFSDNPFIKARYEQLFGEKNKEKYLKLFQGLAQISKDLGCSQAQLAMAWVLYYKNTSCAITGATKLEQLDDIVGAFDVIKKLTPEILKQIEDLLGTRPNPEFNPKTWQLFPYRR